MSTRDHARFVHRDGLWDGRRLLDAGSHVIWIDPEHDVVAVVRWIDKAAMDGFAGHVVAAMET